MAPSDNTTPLCDPEDGDSYRWVIIVIFYIVTALFFVGTFLNFLFMFAFGDRLKIIMKASPVISLVFNLLCMFSFISPILGVYMFYRLYHYGPPCVRFFRSNLHKPKNS